MIDPAEIVEIGVYPPIGVARVGNAPGENDYVLASEIVGGPPTLPGSDSKQSALYVDDFRAPAGEIKRQAVRFRIYAKLKGGKVVELKEPDAEIEWTVAVANLKAGWYEFNEAMDLPYNQNVNALQRNAKLPGTMDRQRLDIVPSPQTISGINQKAVPLSDGQFWSKNVYLGELRTDDVGRLIFLGGKGMAAAFRPNALPLTFANNVGWHDDVSDGPVRAKVTIKGVPFEAKPGYVVVAPPNFAPGIFGVVTMDDVVREVFRGRGWLSAPKTTSFVDDVLPIFERLTDHQWVNHGLSVLHGKGSPLDGRDPAVIKKLNDSSPTNAAWRQSIFKLFGNPDPNIQTDPQKIPQIYGDGVDLFLANANPVTLGLLTVTPTQYEHLERWAKGLFSVWNGTAFAVSFEDLPPKEQIEHLQRAPLHECLGGPFHPAIELTWVMRIPLIWDGPYRLKILPQNPDDLPADQNYGKQLTPAQCTGPSGPYDGVRRGALTRFLGVPWQTDHTSCNSDSEYRPKTYLSFPTFWGARAPDQVLSQGDYLRLAALSTANPPNAVQAHKHLFNRVDWLRDVRGFDYYQRISAMTTRWFELGMVLPVRDAKSDLASVRVEQGRNGVERVSNQREIVDVTCDPKYALVETIEELNDVPPPPATTAMFSAGGAAAASAAPSPSGAAAGRKKPQQFGRAFRQGEI